ncbi:hypothetical protein MHYP_G00194570 [Metynnis hypsauchen]
MVMATAELQKRRSCPFSPGCSAALGNENHPFQFIYYIITSSDTPIRLKNQVIYHRYPDDTQLITLE